MCAPPSTCSWAARNPLIYAGEGVIYAGASEDLKALAELVNVPVVTTLKAKGAFPENHPLFVGVRGDQIAHYLNKSDVILAVGSSLSPGRFSHGIPDAAKKTIIHCNIDELHINKMYPTAHAVIGDARLTLQALRQEVSGRTSGAGRTAGNVAAEVRAARDEALARYRQVMNSDEKPINPYRVYGDLMQVLDLRNSFVTHESGNTRDQLSTVFDTLIPRGFLGWGNVSTLGFSLAAAIAAKKAFPERASVAVTGEAGLGYMLGNLEVLLREKLGITVVHISNGGFAGYGPGFWGPGHDPFTHQVLGPDEVDMSKVIGALGFHTERVSEPAEVIPALRRALDVNTSGKPGVYRVHLLPVPGVRPVGWTGARSETMPKLIPVADALSKPFWDAVNQRRLVLQHCTACDRLQYPPQQACQVCGSAAGLTWKEVEGKGHIASYIVIEDGRLNRRMPDQPYNMAMVTLDADTRVNFYSNLPGTPPYKVPVGAAVEVTFEEVAPDQLIHEWRVVG